MPQVHFLTRVVDPAALTKYVQDVLAVVGMSAGDAGLVAESLVESNLRGIDSHGVARLLHYLERIEAGGTRPSVAMSFSTVAPACGVLDAEHGMGQVAMARATDHAIELARVAGAGWVSVRNSGHCGALAYYGQRIANSGMIGMVLTHSDSMVLPHGGRKAFCGTNPICITAPTADPSSPLCLDMATSITPWNSIVNAAIEGVLLPDGWAVDADGQDTRDANRVAAVYPAAEHKGSGLGIMIDVLCALLGTGPYGPDIPAMYGGDAAANRCLGGLVGAIDVSRFVPLDIFRQRTSELRQRLNAWPTRADVDMVLAPGQPEDLTRAKRVREGVPLGVELLKKFDSIASQFGVQRLASYPMPET